VTPRTAAQRPAAAPAPLVAAALLVALAVAGCSGGSSPAATTSGASVPSGPLSGTPGSTGSGLPTSASGAPAASTSPGPTRTATRAGSTTTSPGLGPTARPTPTKDPIQAKIEELEQSGGVPSIVVRVTGSTVAPAPRDVKVALGQTLRLILLTNTAAHVVGTGVGVDATLKANEPAAVDMVAFTAGTYDVRLTAPGTMRLLRLVAA
jgi:hypothetical protein